MGKFTFKTGTCLLLLIVLGAECDKKNTDSDPTAEECNHETTETNPAKLIIGRWEVTKYNDMPVDKNDPASIEYREFGQDSIAKIQYFKDGDLYTEYHKYWVDSLLHYDHSGYPFTPWHYEFPDNCTLKLDNAFLSFSSIHLIYKRAEQ
jgi:hypothetical protein